MLGFLRRHSCKNFDWETKRLLYLTLVRPHIGYASEVWAPYTIGNITRVESLQRRATKYILNLNWKSDLNYRERLLKSNLLPLSYWHEIKDLTFYFKCRMGLYKVPINSYVKPRPVIRATRNSSPSELLVPNCRTKLFQTSYFNRIPKLWNALPSSTRCLTSVKQFKLLLHKRYFNALQTSFNVDNPNTWKSVCTKCCAQRDILSSKICCY